MQLLQVGVATQVFMSRQYLCSGYVATLSCIICISVATQKICYDRGLLPLSLTSCCIFVLVLRHDFLVLSIFSIATQFSCRDNYSSVFSLLVLSRPSLLCRDMTSLHFCYDLCHDLEVVSRPRFSLLSLFLCCDIKIHFMT